jgi:FkbH-like protein
MFEPAMYERRRHVGQPARPVSHYDPARDIARMSLLVWGEHCIECAAPACFKTCDLYDRRPDRRCRRFAFGIYRNRNFPCLRGYGAEVVFKKWGKLEARGNTRMEPVRRVLFRERALDLFCGIASFVGPLAGWLTGDARWHALGQAAHERIPPRIHRGARPFGNPETFLLEIYNPTSETCRIQLQMTLSAAAIVRDPSACRKVKPFLVTMSIEPGYSRHEIDAASFSQLTDSGYPFDVTLVPEADSDARLVFLTADFVTFAPARKTAGICPRPQIKCVVWDLDHTIWNGALLEDGDVELNARIPAILSTLDQRGILNSIASKNDHDHAQAHLKALGIADYFVHPRIDWARKSVNIKRIAERLNIGLDTLAFIDDNPFEIDEVRKSLPDVFCVHISEVDHLLDHPRLAGSQTADAKERRRFYQNARVRDEKMAEFGDDYMSFLKSCEIVLDVKMFVPEDTERVEELVQRTNQLNFSGTKYGRTEIAAILAAPSREKYVLRCSDRYGSYGTVGFGLVDRSSEEIRVLDFMLSCRVQNKFIEQAFFDFLVTARGPRCADRLWVNFRQTNKNAPARQVLDALGFLPAPEEDGMAISLAGRSLACPAVTVRCERSH